MDPRSRRAAEVHERAIAFQMEHAEHARERGHHALAEEAEQRAEAARRRLERERAAQEAYTGGGSQAAS